MLMQVLGGKIAALGSHLDDFRIIIRQIQLMGNPLGNRPSAAAVFMGNSQHKMRLRHSLAFPFLLNAVFR